MEKLTIQQIYSQDCARGKRNSGEGHSDGKPEIVKTRGMAKLA